MLGHYEKILSILRRCTTNDVSAAQKQLKGLAQQDLQVMSCLQQALRDPTLQSYMKTIATSHINSIFTTNASQYTQDFCFKYFTKLLLEQQIPMCHKRQLARAIMYCLQCCDEDHLVHWRGFTNNCLLSQQICQVGLIMLNAFAGSQIRDNIIQQLDAQPFIFTMKLVCARSQTVQFIPQITYIFQTWEMVLEYLRANFQDQSASVFKKMGKSPEFIRALEIIYQKFSTGTDNYLYIDQNNIKLTTTINQMKRAALQFHHVLLCQVLRCKGWENSPLWISTGIRASIFVNSLIKIAMQPYIIQQYDLDQIIVLILRILYCVLHLLPSTFKGIWKQFIHYILFPLLIVNQQEMVEFQQSTNTFMDLSSDMCQKQQAGTIKSQAAKFLQKLAEGSQILGAQIAQNSEPDKYGRNQTYITKYVINFAIASIKHHLQMQFFNKSDFINGQQIAGQVPLLSVQTAFMVLTIFSYVLQVYKKQIQSIRIIICDSRVQNLPPLQRTRIYVFLAYNYEDIFGSEPNQTSRFWIEKAFSQQNHPTVAYAALDFIYNSLQKIFDQSVVKNIISKIATTREVNFWPLFKKFISLYFMKLSQQNLIVLVEQIYKRIALQIDLLANQTIKLLYVTTNLIHALRTMCQRGQYLDTMPQLKKLLWESSQLLQVSYKYNFEDQIIKIINNYLYYASPSDIQHPQIHKYLQIFINDFIKNDYQPTYYYIAFNNFLMKGSLQTTVIPIYEVLKRSLVFNLNPNSKRQKKQNPDSLIIKIQDNQPKRKKLPIAHTILLLQNILALYGGDLNIEQLTFLTEALNCLHPRVNQNMDQGNTQKKLIIYDRPLLGRGLNLQFLCHMYYQNQTFFKNFRKCHDLKLYYGYDVSVLLACIRAQIQKQSNLQNIIQLLRICINVIYFHIQMDIQIKLDRINKKDSQMRNQQEQSLNTASKIQKRKKATIIRIKKSADFQAILAYINTPFLTTAQKVLGYTKCVKQPKKVRQQFLEMLLQLMNSNLPLVQSIITGYQRDVKHKLQVIAECKIDTILSGQIPMLAQKRKTFKVKNIKQGPINDSKLSQQDLKLVKSRRNHIYLDDEEMSEGQDREAIKRKKAEKKKLEKRKPTN